jgi:hypothetical protein
VLQWTLVCRCLYCILSYILLGRCPGPISLDQMTDLSLDFWGISILLLIVVVLICIPTKSSCFTTSLAAFGFVIDLDYGHSNWDEMKFKCCFDLHLFFSWLGYLFYCYLVVWIPYILWILVPWQMSDLQEFSSLM